MTKSPSTETQTVSSQNKKKGYFILFFGIFLFLFWSSLFPFLQLGIGTGNTLFVLMNENEARPCGGFISAYGVLSIFPPALTVSDVYTLKEFPLGDTQFPLTKVSDTQYFWDLGVTDNQDECRHQLKTTYTSITGTPIENTIILSFQAIENILKPLFPLDFEDTEITEENFFAFFSRKAANVDRHNREALQERKSPMKTLLKKSLTQGIQKPWTFIQMSLNLYQEIQKTKTQSYAQSEIPAFSILEWNLGGGKSSRHLSKELTISIREDAPKRWKIHVQFMAKNKSQADEPIGQDWKGVFEVTMPPFIETQSQFIETHIPQGGVFEKEWYVNYNGSMPPFQIRTNPFQTLKASVSVELFGQQIMTDSSFSSQEHLGEFFGILDTPKSFSWNIIPDTQAPFITLHEIIPKEVVLQNLLEKEHEKWNDSNLFIEIHTNEPIQSHSETEIILKDMNIENPENDTDIKLLNKKILPNKQTILLGFKTKIKQKNEHYSIQVKNETDVFGNTIDPQPKTVIDR